MARGRHPSQPAREGGRRIARALEARQAAAPDRCRHAGLAPNPHPQRCPACREIVTGLSGPLRVPGLAR